MAAFRLAQTFQGGEILALSGDLGAGKTTFVQGLVRGLGGMESQVQSPTFVYLNEYIARLPVYHFDLYRLRTAQDFFSMGFDEYFEKKGLVVIEWPERIGPLLPAPIRVHLRIKAPNQRELVIE